MEGPRHFLQKGFQTKLHKSPPFGAGPCLVALPRCASSEAPYEHRTPRQHVRHQRVHAGNMRRPMAHGRGLPGAYYRSSDTATVVRRSSLRNKRPGLSGRPPCKGVAIGVARRGARRSGEHTLRIRRSSWFKNKRPGLSSGRPSCKFFIACPPSSSSSSHGGMLL